MRLVCPNCDTEYEVDESMIPAAGRDVQCSNCMKTWFQSGPTQAEPETDEDLRLPPVSERRANVSSAVPYLEDDDDDDDDLVDGVPPAAIAALAKKRRATQIDPEAMDVIRQEVQREQTARKVDAGGIETQIDLGLDESDSSGHSARARQVAEVAEIETEAAQKSEDDTSSLQPDAAPVAAPAPKREGATKRELLPDIEEINSTLVEAPDPDELDDGHDHGNANQAKAYSRSGFRLGFGLMLLVAAAVVGIYVYAPAFSQSVPALSGALTSYVSLIDGTRVWLDGSAQDLVDQITMLLASINAG